MKVTYRSKLGIELIIIFLLVPVFIFFADNNNNKITAISSIGVVLLLLFFLYKSTYYTVDGIILIIKSAWLVNEKLDITSITKIAETNNPISSPATSIDRIEIFYNKFDSILISPIDKEKFINHLKKIKPTIKVVYKSKR
ncbi:PH domain-containing protein [Flavobacterium sp. GT2N3]|uniref:PH domain-containing protein n=1 Tax=unclassified Flavobacterium TaxID=196869 RepID=UPI003AADA57B